MSKRLQDELAYPPRAMRAERASAYLDMSRTKFLELVEAGRLPKPKVIDGIRVWDRLALDSAFEDFSERGDVTTSRAVGIPSTRSCEGNSRLTSRYVTATVT